MALGLRLLGLFLLVTIVTGGQHPLPEMSNSLEDLAEIQKDLYFRTVELFNASISGQLSRFIAQLQALEARVEDVEGRFQNYIFKFPPGKLQSPTPCEAERVLVSLNSSLMLWYEHLSYRLAHIEQVMKSVAATGDMNVAEEDAGNEIPQDIEPVVESEPEPTPPTTTTRRKPKTRPTRPTRRTRPTTTTPPPTTTLPPTTTTMPTTIPTTTPTTTQAPTTTPMPTPATCAELAQRGDAVSGRYLIDPTMSGRSFYVHCELPAGVTSISHDDDEREILNNDNEDPASFQFAPVYGATIQQMKALTAASQNCSQFISYRCKGAVLLAEEKKTGMRYGYWESVDGEQIISWGGTPVNSKQCACALTRQGCLQGRPCNCDSNPKSFAVDEGLLTDKPYLPVTSVYLGDTGSKKEIGHLMLGPLRCQ